MSSGGGGGSGTQKYEWNDYLKKPWADAIEYAGALKDKPFNPYPYQRIADINGTQQDAMNLLKGTIAGGGTQASQSAQDQAQQTLDGSYLTGAGANPYASQANAFQGMSNPYFNQTLRTGLDEITNQYKQGTSADTTRMFNMAGAFGGSAHQNAVANNEAALGKSLGNYVTGMQNDQYNRSGMMDESRLGRASGAFEGERGRQVGAIGAGYGANDQFYKGIQQYMGVGDIERGYSQDLLNQYFNDWQQQQNYPQSQLDYYTGVLGRAQGGISPNVTATPAGYSASPYSQVLGAGLLAYGMR